MITYKCCFTVSGTGPTSADTDNYRNGFTCKTLQTKDGQFELNTPRDRDGSFEPGWSKQTSAVSP